MKKVLAGLLVVVWSGGVNATTIDFDDLALGGAPVGGDLLEVIVGDYRFLSERGVIPFGDPGNQGISGLSSGGANDVGQVSISRVDGQAFALLDIDLFLVASFSASVDGGVFSGSLADIGAGDWLNITQVTFESEAVAFAPVSIDNVVVGSAVPVPAAVWLFGSGLAALGWLRRRRS
jgi:hypothetical protein